MERILGERNSPLHLPGRFHCCLPESVPSGDSLTPTDTSWKPPCPSLMTYNASSVQHRPHLRPFSSARPLGSSVRSVESRTRPGNRSPSTLITQLPLLLNFREAHMSRVRPTRWESFQWELFTSRCFRENFSNENFLFPTKRDSWN